MSSSTAGKSETTKPAELVESGDEKEAVCEGEDEEEGNGMEVEDQDRGGEREPGNDTLNVQSSSGAGGDGSGDGRMSSREVSQLEWGGGGGNEGMKTQKGRQRRRGIYHADVFCTSTIYVREGREKEKIVKLVLTRQFAYRRKSNRSFLHGLQCIYIVHSRI